MTEDEIVWHWDQYATNKILQLKEENKRLREENKALKALEPLMDENIRLREALKFYAEAKTSDDKPGARREFGCGCCAGTVDKDGCTDFDSSVIGLTAREVLGEK